MEEVEQTKVLIVGAGPAGYTAAIYAARAGLEPVVMTGEQPGGQLTITTDVENYPGFATAVQGPQLMQAMREQAANAGTQILEETLTAIEGERSPFLCHTAAGAKVLAQIVIVATGAKAKWLGLESEQQYMGRGVSACATCDGFFFRNMEVCVVGGGNTAMEEALYLANLCSKVILIHRRDRFRGEQVLRERVLAHPKIEVCWNHVVAEILGDEQGARVSAVRLSHVHSGTQKTVPVAGVFVAIGHSPNTAIFQDMLALDADGYIITKKGEVSTSVPGIFAAGDVQDKIYRQAVTAAGSGCMAALEAEGYLSQLDSPPTQSE